MKKQPSGGFTLAEMMLVMAIGAILFMTFYAPYGFFNDRAKLHTSANKVEQEWSLGKIQAMNGIVFSGNTNGNIFMTFTKNTNHLPMYVMSGKTVPPFSSISGNSNFKKISDEYFDGKNIIRSIKIEKQDNSTLILDSIGFFLEAPSGSGTFVLSGGLFDNTIKKIIITVGHQTKLVLEKNIQLLPFGQY